MDVFGGAPRFLAYPRPVVVQSGTDAVLKCQIGGDPRPAVIWERNNEQIHPEGRYRLFEDGNVYNLIISSVTTEDSGQYTCKAKNSIGETYAAATLKVEGEAQEMELREENKPRFLIKPLSTRVGRGEDAVFSCKLWGNPRPEVVWEKDGRKLNEIFESTHFNVGYQDGGWFQLKIFKTRAPDGGVYTCKARNEFGEGLAGAVLLVDAGPGHEEEGNRNGYTNGHWKGHQGKQRSGRQLTTRLKDDPVTNQAKQVKMFAVTEGKHAKFRCFVTGKPKPEIIWRKDGRLIMSGRRYLLYEDREGYFTLKVLYCKQQDNGVYVCAASNTAGQTLSAVHLSVKEPPVRFKQPLIDLEVWERDLAVLECEVPEDSVPITWYLEDRRLQPGAKYGMEEWGTKRRLTIRDIGVDDDGIYLCEMADGGRSIAEVAVKGTIVRKLPRKVDVLEGENAAFCVEVEEEEMDIHWYKEGTELRETHQTILKSFGKTHILVFVNTTPQDSGLVTFFVGRSKTSSQLRVKAARHSPPSCPVGVQINTERANAALLSWVPAQDTRKNPPSGYVLERQEVGTGSQEWLQCLTTDSATSVEILGDSVPCEADYRFRICSVNKYGRSNNVEFPRAVHLVPVTRIQAPLQDALVPEGQDACFSIELTASVIGSWFLNGTQLLEDDRYSMRRSRTHQSLRIQGVRDTDNGAEITFIAYGIRDSAALYIQAPLVKFTPLSEMDRNKFVELGNPIVLYCELSDPAVPVHWYKNGVEVHTVEGLHIQSEGTMRRIVIQSSEFSHSGVYCCDAIDDVIRFNVEVEAPPVRFSALPEAVRNKSIEAGCPIVLQCELSDPTAQVYWYKDGTKLLPQSGIEIQSDGITRTLVVQSAEIFYSGSYSCKTKGDAIKFNVEVKVPPVRFSVLPEAERNRVIEAGCPIVLKCELSDPTAQVYWYKDGIQLFSNHELDIQSEGNMRTLVVQSAELTHSGTYSCTTVDDTMEFHVDIKAVPVTFSAIFDVEKTKSVEAGCPFQLQCEVTDPTAQVYWCKDGEKLLPQTGMDIQSNGTMRKLIVQSAGVFHSGLYNCETSDDTLQFTVDIKAPPVKFLPSPEVVKSQPFQATCPIELPCEISDPIAQVSRQKDKVEPISDTGPFEMGGIRRNLVVQPAHPSNSGAYYCATAEDVAPLIVQNQAPPMTYLVAPEVEKNKSIEAGLSIVQQFEISDPIAQVCWDKDGTQIYPHSGLDRQSKGSMRTLFIQPDDMSCGGRFDCQTTGDTTQCNVAIKAELSHPGSEKGEISDESSQYTMDIKAAPVRVSADQAIEKNKSIEEVCPVEVHCEPLDSTVQILHYKYGQHLQTYGIYSTETPSLQSVEHFSIETPTVQSAEHYSMETATLHSPELFGSMETATFQSAELYGSMQTPTVQSAELYGSMQTPTVQSAELYGTMHTPTHQSAEVCGSMQTLTLQSAELYDSMQTQTLQSAELYGSIHTPTHQSAEVCGSMQTLTLQSAELYDSMQTQTLQSAELYGSIHTPTHQSAEVCGSMQTLTFQSAELYDSMQTQTLQSAELYGSIHTPTHQSAEVCGSMQTPTLQSAELYDSMQTQTLQSAELYGSIHTPTHQSAEVCGSTQTPTFHPTEVCGSVQTPTLQSAELCCSMKTPTLQSAELYTSMKTPTLQPAELYQLGECDSQLDDDDIAFKVDVEAPPVRITTPCEAERNKSVAAGGPIVLRCEISDPNAHVSWYKDGTLLHEENGLEMQSEGSIRTLDVESARLSDSGSYSCKTTDDAMQFHVDVKAPPPKFSAISEADKKKYIKSGYPIVLQCELSDPTIKVYWYKDGTKLLTQSGVDIQSDGTMRTLVIQSAELSHSGVYRCETMEDGLQFTVEVKAPPVRFSALPEAERNKFIEDGCPIILQCELSDPTAQVYWYKDGTKLLSQSGMEIQSDGIKRTLLIQSAEILHGGTYECSTAGDTITFKVEIKALPVRFSALPEVVRNKFIEAGCPIVLQCELSDPTAQVFWYKDGTKLLPENGVDIQSEGALRAVILQSAELSHSGVYSCEALDDCIAFKVDVAAPIAPPVRFSAAPEVERNTSIEAGCPIVLQCELSDPSGQICWYKDGIKLLPQYGIHIQSEGTMRTLVIQSATFSSSGVYSCKTADDISEFYVDVKAPPVTFVDIPEEDLFKSVVEQDRLVMSCEVSRVDAIVQWYKDGVETQSSDNIAVHADCTVRMLTIQSAQLSDSGTYTCRAGDRALMFKVNIREPPVMIVYPKEDVHLDRHVPEEIILSCELSRLNGVVNWFKDGQKLQESENIKLKIEGPYRRLKILCSGVEDSGEYVCDTADDSIFFNLSITEPPVQIISPSQSQMELCQQTSERMVLSCEISRPNAVVRWYRDGLEVEENDNLILEVDGVYRRLIIPETTVKDSAEYVCDTADDNMTFFVNIADPPVRFVRPRKMASRVEMFVGDSLVLDCEVSRSNATVSWKKNGEEMEESSNVTVIEDGVMRQLTIHSMTLEDAGQYVCDAKDDVMDFQVKIKETPVKILSKNNVNTQKQFFASDDIVLGCELSRANCMVVWYKDNKKIDDNERYCSEEQGVFRSLVVLNAEIDDSGEYTCDAGDDKMVFYITVKEPPVTIIGNSGNPEHHSLVAGDKLILECEISCPNATVQWLWNGKLLSSDARTHIDSDGATRKLVLSGLQPSDSGEYILDAINDKMVTIVEVQEPPVKFVNKQARTTISGYENESVTLRAMVNREQAYVRWLKDGELLNGDNIHISSAGKMHTLTINPLKLSDSGGFVCNINTDEMYFIVQVKEMKVKFSRPLQNIVALKDSTLTLRCEVNKPKGDVQWLKDGQEIKPSRRHTIRAQGRERSITIHQLMLDNAGEYACESTDDKTFATVGVEMPPPTVEIIAELHNITVLEGEDATFKCVVSPEDTQLVWSLNGQPIVPSERFVISSNGLCHMLCIYNCQVSDCATVTAEAEGLVSEANLQVQEQQVLFTKNMVPVVAEQFGEATLEVEVGLDSGEVQWMRQGVVIHPGPKFTLKQKCRRRSLTIHKLALSDRGTYSCETLHDRTQAQLIVEPRKITIRRGLTDIQTIQRETASFEVELSHSNVEATWLKDGNQLKPNNHWRMSAKGCVHSLTISNLTLDDTGTFVLSAENVKSSARLIVKEPPVTVIKKLEDLRFPEAAVASMDCELSRPHVEVKWMKNGIEVKPRKDLRIYAMGRKHYFQILKCEVSDSGTYSCDAGDSSTSCNIAVYERELVVLQGLEDLDIQEDQNAVFVVEISLEDVPGEWFKNGVRITPTSTIKIRQEGTKHFLLMCNVRGEDSGEIKFVAKHVECTAYLEVEELPLNITNPLQDKVALERSRAIMDCSVSNPRCSIRWYKGSNVILPSERFEICSEGCYRKLVIQQVALDDEGTYSVQVGEHTCSAKLTVEAQSLLMVRELKSVEVVAPDEACFECEVSVPVLKAPVWSLKGEALQQGPKVSLEKMGMVHRLTLRQTSVDMNGLVEFTSGKAKSSAELHVKSDP
ncbi:obscurin isoform X3 [Oncorhynchus mykiss]|uniref:obscurin isoform X3 n=1 Tax=Oncorhynchus mykiss TaxID=8022 RepID=UPI001878F48E|nr:obscurin isoform X3 [Oncorhynchus mykiss]